jgi:hypothetical protein
LAAQIAVGLAGFAGVVVVFRRGSLHELSPIDKYRLWLLLANSAVPLLCCLFAFSCLPLNPRRYRSGAGAAHSRLFCSRPWFI